MVVGIGVTGAAVSTIPAAFTHVWHLWAMMSAVTLALIATRWRKARRLAAQRRTPFKAKDRARVISGSLRPLNYYARGFALIALVAGFASKIWIDYSVAHNDESGYLQAQVLHAVAVAPKELNRAIELSNGGYNFSVDGNFCAPSVMSERKMLINNVAIPDVIRATMLRVDARCERDLANEVRVAEDIRQIHAFPFMIGNPDLAAIADAFFSFQDYDAGAFLARSSTPTAQLQLRQMARHTRDPRLRHAIKLALAT